MKLKIALAGLCLICLSLSSAALTPTEIVDKLDQNFAKIKDATADITLETSLFIFGCSGKHALKGQAWYKSPDKIKAELDGVTYFGFKNSFRKIDQKGKKWYVKLINAIDFAVGYNPKLIAHNFQLSVIEENEEKIVLEGLPKPGMLKNVKKVLFFIDPQEYLLRGLDVKFFNERLGGKIDIEYQKIDGVWTPVSFSGQSAIVIREGFLVGLDIKLSSENLKINTGLPDEIFEPGF